MAQHAQFFVPAGVQDAPQEMERNKAAAKQSTVRPSNQLLLTFHPFPVGHSAHEHATFVMMSTGGLVRPDVSPCIRSLYRARVQDAQQEMEGK